LDTNVLVYADSADEPGRQARAIELIKLHRAAGTAVLATQVLQEFVNVALRRLGLPAQLIRERLDFYSRFELVQTTPALIAAALELA
jgi:predicted nucleic acid-binding protein